MKNKESKIIELLALLVCLFAFIISCLGILAVAFAIEGYEYIEGWMRMKAFPLILCFFGGATIIFSIYIFYRATAKLFELQEEKEKEEIEKKDDTKVDNKSE